MTCCNAPKTQVSTRAIVHCLTALSHCNFSSRHLPISTRRVSIGKVVYGIFLLVIILNMHKEIIYQSMASVHKLAIFLRGIGIEKHRRMHHESVEAIKIHVCDFVLFPLIDILTHFPSCMFNMFLLCLMWH